MFRAPHIATAFQNLRFSVSGSYVCR